MRLSADWSDSEGAAASLFLDEGGGSSGPSTERCDSVSVRSVPSSAVPTVSVVHSPSLSFSQCHLPADALLISQSLLAAHLRCLGRFRRLRGAHGVRRMDLREKLLSWRWMADMLTPEDGYALIHSAPLGPTWFSDIFGADYQPHLAHAVTAFAGLAASASASAPSAGERRAMLLHGGGHCDGGRCFGFCPFFRALLTVVSTQQSWARSPDRPLADVPDVPNHALLVIRHLHDDRVAQRQQATLDQAGVAVARELTAQLERGGPLSHVALLPSEEGEGKEERGEPWCAPAPPSPASLPSSLLRLELSMSVQVNSAFERLLGYAQAELRDAFMAYGEKALYRLFRADAWPRLMDFDKDVRWTRRREFSALCVCLTRGQRQLPCLVHCLNHFDAAGRPRVSMVTLLPLPDASTEQ